MKLCIVFHDSLKLGGGGGASILMYINVYVYFGFFM